MMISYPPPAIGDILYSDFSYGSTYDSSKTPIAVCVAPASHFANGKARWMSLVNMSATTPETGTTVTGNNTASNPGAGFCWGGNAVDIPSLTNFDAVPSFGVAGSATTSEKATGHSSYVGYPIQHKMIEEGICGPVEGRPGMYVYYEDCSPAQCLINVDGSINQNVMVSEVNSESFNNALTDKDGKVNTSILWSLATNGKVGEITRNASTSSDYPAAVACHRFYTEGTAAGDWYLPALGELAYVTASLDTINHSLETVGDLAVKVGDYDTRNTLGFWLWSSSEYDGSGAWGLYTFNGDVSSDNKAYSNHYSRVRAFMQF